MTKFESSVKQIPHSQQSVYNTLSDMSNVQRLKDRLPDGDMGNADMDKVKEKLKTLPLIRILFLSALILWGKSLCVSLSVMSQKP